MKYWDWQPSSHAAMAMKLFYRSGNAIFAEIGRISSEEVIYN